MQNATTLLSIIRNRGKAGKPLEGLYRQLYNLDLYRLAYSASYANKGATTPGAGDDTLDGMSESRFVSIIDRLKCESYRWQSVRRTYIPKGDGRRRPLGIPSGDDKILQTVLKLLLEAYYEPQFSDRSHGFRPHRGCHTALMEIQALHRGVSWFIEGDIKGFYDNIKHDILLKLLAKDIHDNRFLELMRRLLEAGYMEDWVWHKTMSGAPQGGTLSPLLSNIYLHPFDRWVETELKPFYDYGKERGGRPRNPEYRAYHYQKWQAWKRGDAEAYRRFDKLMKSVPSVIDNDTYRKLAYVRYADDVLLSFAGPRTEAEAIKSQLRDFLDSELGLELSMEKTLITHARTEKAKFLGYEVSVMQNDERQTNKGRSINGRIRLGIPREKLTKMKRRYMRNGKVVHRPEWLLNSDYDIISYFQAEYRGYVQYYIMAHDLGKLSQIRWIATTSLLKTLAAKFRTSVNKMVQKYETIMTVDDLKRKVFQVTIPREGKPPLVATFGGLPLKRNPKPVTIKDDWHPLGSTRSELIMRMMSDECEMCGSQGDTQVHHVRKLKDLNKPGRSQKPLWIKRMAALRRKTLIVCIPCHRAIHRGEHRKEWDVWKDILESRMN